MISWMLNEHPITYSNIGPKVKGSKGKGGVEEANLLGFEP